MKKLTSSLFILLFFGINILFGQTTAWTLTFETTGDYSTSVTEFTDNATDYFLRTNGSNITGESFSNIQGSYYFAAQDIDAEGASLPVYLTTDNIDISGYSGLSFSVYLAEDDASDGNDDWDIADYVHFEYSIDGGTWTNLLWVENDGTTYNGAPQIDTDFNGTGDGTDLTNTFTQFSASISGTGSLMQIRITFNLDAGDEDIAIDNLLVEGTYAGGTSNTITNGTVSSSSFTTYCASGASGTVTFTSSGTFTSGNVYTAQLSDASGSFTSATTIGTLTSTANTGTISFTIPAGAATGTGYLIRIISSNPAVTGSSSSAFSITLSDGPCSCFEIESLLVDACGTPEGANEMFRFKVGGSAINVSDISVSWPNNSWLGLCQNTTTAGIVSAINATITSGGQLIEPTSGVIPAGTEVMFFTSTAFDYSLFDFSSLNYDLYVIFQCSGNTAGHFANHTSSGDRTLSMTISGCGSDNVTYNCGLLYNGDGGIVNYTTDGTASYPSTGSCETVPIDLPVELLYFNTDCSDDNIVFFWATATETNNDYFTIEGSNNTTNFESLAIINGAGNSNITQKYSITLENSDYNYFRLKQTDFDGAYSYSSIQYIDCMNSAFKVYPSIIFAGEEVYVIGEVSEITAYDLLGQKINFIFDNNIISGLQRGVYIIVINQVNQYKLIVQ